MKNSLLFLALLLFVCTQTSKSQHHYPVLRHERPPVDINSLPSDAFEPGKLLIKIREEFHETIPDVNMKAGEQGHVITGVSNIDLLNEHYPVNEYFPFFSPLYESNYNAHRYRERHKAWGFHLWFELTLPSTTDIIDAVLQFRSLEEIEFAEPVYKKELIGSHEPDAFHTVSSINQSGKNGWIPNDPQFNEQWHYYNTGQTGGTPGADIRLNQAWEIEKGRPEVIVAVIDGGIDYNHVDLAGNMWDQIGFNFTNNTPDITPHQHGTHVAGTVAAVNNNGTGVAGVAGGSGSNDGVRLMSCQVFSYAGNGGFHLAPVYAADNGAAISQNSWGYTVLGVYEQAVLDAIDYFNANGGGTAMSGGITIFSAGNRNMPGPQYPACYPGAFSVAATNHNDQKAYYSTYDYWVDISAPGGETLQNPQQGVLSTLNFDTYGYYQGTSMASPHCSGVAALLISAAYGTIDAETLADIIRSTTDDHYSQNPSFIGQLGTGRLNAFEALQHIGVGNPPKNLIAFPGNEIITLQWEAPDPDTLAVTGYNVYRDNMLINQEPINETIYNDTDVINYTSYSYFVKALYDTLESFRSNLVEVTPHTGFAGGTGTNDDPYLVGNAEQLFNVRFHPGDFFRQISDIDLDLPPWNVNEGWQPIGCNQQHFFGAFDGNGFLIENLFIHMPQTSYVGLFGYTIGAAFTNIGIVNALIEGRNYAGLIAGKLLNGSISQCYVQGAVVGNEFIGGMAGMIEYATIDNAYSSVEVAGFNYVGGLAGFSKGDISLCYSTGMVSGSLNTGGLIGSEENSATTSSFWNIETTAQIISSGGEALTTAQMILQNSFENWDFISTWNINENITYPWLGWQQEAGSHNFPPQFVPPSHLECFAGDSIIVLSWQAPSLGNPMGYNIYRNGIKLNTGAIVTETTFTDDDLIGFELYSYQVTAVYENNNESALSNAAKCRIMGFQGGSGTPEDPYLVATAYQLDAIRLFPEMHFRQIADIDLGAEPWNTGEGWEPIGGTEDAFTGSYNGSGHKIQNLFINKPDKSLIGLFGAISNGTVKHLTIENTQVSGKYQVGSLAGSVSNGATIEYVKVLNAYMLLEQRYCGVLIGRLDDATVYRCYSTGNITRGSYDDWNTIGGLIGAMTSSSGTIGSYVIECFSTVDISSLAHNSYGGLLGGIWHKGEIQNCYARGSVTGSNARAGGLSSDVSLGTAQKLIRNSYSTGLITAPGSDVNGFLGWNSGGTFSANFYDIETSGLSGYDPAATGKTTEQMKTMSTFVGAGWDFDEVWAIDPDGIINDGYPYLQWQFPVFLPGDSNCDGNVNVLDVSTTINYFLGHNPLPFCFDNADVNADGQIDVLDVIETIAIILAGS